MPVQRCSPADLLDVTGNDPFVRSQARYRFGPAWHSDGAAAFVSLDAEGNVRHLAAVGQPERVAGLVAAAIREIPDVPRLSLPRGTPEYLPAWLRLDDRTDWDFRSTTHPPPVRRGQHGQPGQDRVGWLGDADAPEVAELLTAANPGSSAWPGDARVGRWAGIRAACGRLDACLADTSGAGVGHFAAISTRPGTRGRGLGSAITAWATRRLFEEGYGIVTLGVYADNAAARRMYDRLGFTDDHHFTSGVPTHGVTTVSQGSGLEAVGPPEQEAGLPDRVEAE